LLVHALDLPILVTYRCAAMLDLFAVGAGARNIVPALLMKMSVSRGVPMTKRT
jgi:hypothetical protein